MNRTFGAALRLQGVDLKRSAVTVNRQAATRYGDNTFAKSGFSLSDGTNTFGASATDSLGRSASHGVGVYLPATATFQYDGNANLVSDGRRGVEYDDENQLVAAYTDTYYTSASARWKSVWVYDGRGRARIRRDYTWSNNAWTLSADTRLVYDGMRVIQERDGRNGNVPTVSYTRGLDLSGTTEGAGGIGGMLARSHGYNAGNGTWSTHSAYHADGNGNITCLINASQQVVASYRYDPYGRTLSASGTLSAANTYRFSSKEIHAKSGMYYYGFRFYDPSLQRWLNRDPLGGYPGIELKTARGQIDTLNPWERYEGPNLYAYAHNAPINLTDINGLWTIGVGGRAGYGFFVAGDISLGFYFGYSKENGWSCGFLESTLVGAGGPPNMSAGCFAQWTNAKCVGQLKGLGGAIGASGGEGPGGGGDFVFGGGYQGGSAWGGITGGSPVEIHAGGTLTSGWDSGKGWRY